jgi:hypothetical protein
MQRFEAFAGLTDARDNLIEPMKLAFQVLID